MDRRDFIKHTGAATAAAVAAGATTVSAASAPSVGPHLVRQRRELRLAMPWPQNGRGPDDSARRLVHALASLSDGQYQITVLPAVAGIEALASGDADLVHASGHDFFALDSAFAYFAGLPGSSGLRPTYLNAWLTAGGGARLWDALAADHGFKPLLTGHTGARSSLWSRRPIASLGDLAGRRIAAPGIGRDVVHRLGATPVDLGAADLASALQGGDVDAVEWSGTISAYACGLNESARVCLRPGLMRNGFSTVLAVSSNFWNQLAPSDQAMFEAAAALELNTTVAETLSSGLRLRKSLAERHAIAFQRPSIDTLDAARRACDEVVADLSSSSPQAARIHASYMAFRAGLPPPRRRASSPPIA